MEIVVAEASSELSRSSFISETGSTSTWPEPRARTAVAGRGWIPMLDFPRPLFFSWMVCSRLCRSVAGWRVRDKDGAAGVCVMGVQFGGNVCGLVGFPWVGRRGWRNADDRSSSLHAIIIT